MDTATDANGNRYAAFLLRMWREDLNGRHVWRSILQDAQTREEHNFVDLEMLVSFLREQYSEGEGGAIGGRKASDHK